MKVKGFTEPVSAYVLEATPDILSMGVLCMQHGYGFHWEPFSCTPLLIAPNGRAVVCKVRHNVPYVDPESLQAAPVTMEYAPFSEVHCPSPVSTVFTPERSWESWGRQFHP